MDGAADVAETTYTPFQSEPDAAPVRLIVRRVKPTPGSQLALFATYSYHGFITDRDGEMLELEADHRRHAEIENAIRDLKHGVGLNHRKRLHFWNTVPVMLNILGSLAEFELELIRERVKAGMDRARRQGKRIGRPGVTDRRGFDRRFGAILERLSSGELSRRKAAFEPGIGYATLKRLIDAQESAG